jgi:peptidoglycan/LPS O-acetylase OafA/YrhL
MVGVPSTEESAARTPESGGDVVVQAGEVRLARIESLRALAALAVLAGHVFGFAHAFAASETLSTFPQRLLFGGGFGVYLFFALSGYLIYWPFASRDFGGAGRVDHRRYAINRALRILPLYWVSVVVVLLLLQDGGTATQWWRFMLFAENFSAETAGKVNVLWSVVVELTFYALVPVIAIAVAKTARGSRARAATAIAGLAGVSLLIWYLQVYRGGAEIWRFNLPATFFFFAGGMLVALLRTAWKENLPSWVRRPFDSSDFWLLASVPLFLIAVWRYQHVWVLALPSAMIVAACVLPLRTGVLTRMLGWRPLALIGVASYSLYIWHVPILDALTGRSYEFVSWVPEGTFGLAVVAVPLALLTAFASYVVIESPFLRLRHRWSSASARTEEPPASVPALQPRPETTT